ncbi:MAG: hypothetical protein H7Z11_03490 [Verrucomicrobia bacterium]|nr:hypothetical protein [Leptolyngbya sp. ES-bin-22]
MFGVFGGSRVGWRSRNPYLRNGTVVQSAEPCQSLTTSTLTNPATKDSIFVNGFRLRSTHAYLCAERSRLQLMPNRVLSEVEVRATSSLRRGRIN